MAGLDFRGEAQRRDILVHVHIFKNAGSSIDASLKTSFGRRWRNIDPPDPAACIGNLELVTALSECPSLEAVSSHQLRFPLEGAEAIRLHPFLLLRHPLDRARSIYDWERLPQRQQVSNAPHTRQAGESTFREFIAWCLQAAKAPIANYQTRLCSLRHNGSKPGDWRIDPNMINLSEALDFLPSLPVVGIVEEFDATVLALNATFGLVFGTLNFEFTRKNTTRAASFGHDLSDRLQALEQELGPALYRELLRHNELDLELYEWARRRLGGCGLAFEND